MANTKSDVVKKAYEEIGMGAYAYDLEPEQLQSACERLDSMVSSWGAVLSFNYPLHADNKDAMLNEKLNVPDVAIEALYTNLAISLAPTVGKTVSRETLARAKQSKAALYTHNAKFVERTLPSTMPLGAGNKPWRYGGSPFITPTRETNE